MSITSKDEAVGLIVTTLTLLILIILINMVNYIIPPKNITNESLEDNYSSLELKLMYHIPFWYTKEQINSIIIHDLSKIDYMLLFDYKFKQLDFYFEPKQFELNFTFKK